LNKKLNTKLEKFLNFILVNNCEEEENSPTILRPYLPRMAKDFTKAIKLTYATPQFQNQRRRGEFRSDSGQSSRTYSRLIISVM